MIVGFSGGLDSTALLHLLSTYPALHSRILAVHVNHGLSANALIWQRHCEGVCQKLNLPFTAQSVEFDRSANIEEGARNARFAVYSELLTSEDCLLLGHHLDDQAETLLLQLMRGAGVDGLAGMKEFKPLSIGHLARPLLIYSRAQIEAYAQAQGLDWIEDESNVDVSYSRNYVRHQVMPLLINKWPGVVGNLARTAVHCQQAQTNLQALAIQDCPELTSVGPTLGIEPLKSLDEERIINVLRVWLRHNELQLPSTVIFQRLIHELLWASPDAMPLVSWNDVCIRRYQSRIYIEPKTPTRVPNELSWAHFPKPLAVAEGLILHATLSDAGLSVPEHAQLSIKFRQGGEHLVLHGQTKQLKKLLQEWQVPPWLRDCIPLLYVNEQLAAVVGYAISDLFYSEQASSFSVYFVRHSDK